MFLGHDGGHIGSIRSLEWCKREAIRGGESQLWKLPAWCFVKYLRWLLGIQRNMRTWRDETKEFYVDISDERR